MARRRYVVRGAPGGYRLWDNKARLWWGDLYEPCPDELVAELNTSAPTRADPQAHSTGAGRKR